MKGYKTFVFNVLVLVSAILGLPQWQGVLTSAEVLGVFAVVNIVLRALTSSPIFSKS